MPAPTNTTAPLATDLGTLPASVTQTVDFSGTTYTVWYKYTATVSETVINVFPFGDLTTYIPSMYVYTGPDTAPVSYLGIGVTNRPIQMPVTAGVTYYFEIIPNGGNPTPAVLTLTSVTGPTASAPVGTIVVPDDTDGFPASFVDSATGDVLRFAQFPAGEKGDVSAAGYMLVNDDYATPTGELVWIDPQFNEVSRLAFDADSLIRINRTSDVFYVGNGGGGLTHAFITTVSNAGMLGGTTWTFAAAGLIAGCANPDDTIFYYAAGGGSGSAVKRWDLTNDVALSDLVATTANYVVCDMLGLDDGSILVLYYKSSITRDAYVKQYSSAGATVRTFNLGSDQSSTPPKLAYAADHPLSFWVMSHTSTHFSVFTNLLVSDGSTVVTFQTPEYEGGAYQPAQTATPAADFGVSFSCPFFLTRVLFPAAATGAIRVVKVVVPSVATGTFAFTAGGGLSPSTFELNADGDEQVFSGVTAGDGYSIAETGHDNFFLLSVEVSNDSPAYNISVASDETVVVTVTNSQSPAAPDTETFPIRWLRASPTVSHDGKRLFHRRFQVDFQPGVGLPVAEGDYDRDPIVLCRTSDDGGFTWSNVREMTLGERGKYLKQMKLYQLGATYARVYEISGDSPVPLCIVQAWLDVEGGKS